MRKNRLHPLIAVLTAAGLAAGLSGCSLNPGAAAVSKDHRVSMNEVNTVQREVTEIQGSAVGAETIAALLALAPYTDQFAADNGLASSDDDAKAAIEHTLASSGADVDIASLSPATIDVYRYLQETNKMAASDDVQRLRAELDEVVTAADITLNPRFGVLDPVGPKLSAVTYQWLPQAATAG